MNLPDEDANIALQYIQEVMDFFERNGFMEE